MIDRTIGLWMTSGGFEAFRLIETTLHDGRKIYRYNGKHGSGCGRLDDIMKSINFTISCKRGITAVMVPNV